MIDALARAPIGSTGVSVTRLGFGTAALAHGRAWGDADPLTEDQAVDALLYAFQRGIAYFDTAPSYGGGAVEPRLGLALRHLPRAAVTISTKVGYTRGPGGIAFDYSADGVRRSIDASLTRLGVDRLDIVHVHDPERHLAQVVVETIPALNALRDQGVIGAVSVGLNVVSVALELIARAPLDAMMIAGRYTLLEQGAAPLIAACQARGIALMAAAIYNSGILATGPDAPDARYNHAAPSELIRSRARLIEAVCARHGVALMTAAAQFPLRHAGVACAVVGWQTRAEIDACLAALAAPIPDALWHDLHVHGLLDPDLSLSDA